MAVSETYLNHGSIPLRNCRKCRGTLNVLLDFGAVPASGVFVSNEDMEKLQSIPLSLATCPDCGLTQLGHDIRVQDLYTATYGYRSSLNHEMLQHLESTARYLFPKAELLNKERVNVLDIASNDGSLLSFFSHFGRIGNLWGVDPLINYFPNLYPKNALKVSEFFGSQLLNKNQINEKFQIITSLSVLYDVDDLQDFVDTVSFLLDENGLWYTEQSYFIRLLEEGTFDSVCHEHILYLTLKDLVEAAENSGLSVIEVVENDVNGGSIGVLFEKKNKIEHDENVIANFRLREDSLRMKELLEAYPRKVISKIAQINESILALKSEGKSIYALGASTKGNIILSACNLDSSIIEAVGEINVEKFGKYTPVGMIPILGEEEVLKVDSSNRVVLILPWHFRETFLKVTNEFVKRGGTVIFPFPALSVVN